MVTNNLMEVEGELAEHCCLVLPYRCQGFVLPNTPSFKESWNFMATDCIFSKLSFGQRTYIWVRVSSKDAHFITPALDPKGPSSVITGCQVSLFWTSDLLTFKVSGW